MVKGIRIMNVFGVFILFVLLFTQTQIHTTQINMRIIKLVMVEYSSILEVEDRRLGGGAAAFLPCSKPKVEVGGIERVSKGTDLRIDL